MSASPPDPGAAPPWGRGVEVLVRDANGLTALSKPAGLLSHPNTLAEQPRSLLTCAYDAEGECFRWRDAAGAERRCWLLNRLDGATSGVILTADSAALAAAIKEQFAARKVRKLYVALVFGHPAGKMEHWHDLLAVQRKGGVIRADARRGNVPSHTQVQVLRHQRGAFSTAVLRLEPHTGRSHQLRVQCAKRHLPIVGDQTYGDFALNRAFARAAGTKRLFLHSFSTAFTYQWAGQACHFKAVAPVPEEFERKY